MNINPMNIYQTIWLNPSRTFEEAVANKTKQPLIALPFIIVGIMAALDSYADIIGLYGVESIWGLTFVIPICIGFCFLIMALIIPGLIRLIGKIWKGPATMRQMVNVCSLSLTPIVFVLIYQLVLLAFGIEPTLEHVNGGLSNVLWLWSFSLLIIGVAKVQRFSYGMALLNILMSYLPLLLYGLWRA